MEVVGSIDQGTQSTRFTLYDKNMKIVATSQIPLNARTPHAGYASGSAASAGDDLISSRGGNDRARLGFG